MLASTLIMAMVAAILLAVGYFRGEGQHLAGMRAGLDLGLSILPLLVMGLLVAGMILALVPQEAVAKWLGGESGFKGILIGTAAGSITPGGPFITFPIVAGLLRHGAGPGTAVAFITAWMVVALPRVPMEVGILGWKFTGIRLACTFFFPLLAGFIAQTLFTHIE